MKRYFIYVVGGLFAAATVLVGAFFLHGILRQAETASFYEVRPILNSMNRVHDGIWTDNSHSARSALLVRLPMGVDLSAALPTLQSEGFECARPAVVSEVTVNCQSLAPAASGGSTRWIVDLRFDERARLADAKVAVWNIWF